jgi:uncharacterized protein (UPF0548 family)
MNGPVYSWNAADELALAAFRLRQGRMGFSYPHLGCTAKPAPPEGYCRGEHRIHLGHGEEIFDTARSAIQRWQQFPTWVRLDPPHAPMQAGASVAVLARVLGVWVWNACRVLEIEDTPTRFSLTYGTLPGHAMLGEERFRVELLDDGRVDYSIRADSRPAGWAQWPGLLYIRHFQRRFRHDSSARMQQIVAQDVAVQV